MLSCVVNTQDRRMTTTGDIIGEFMQENMDEIVHVKI